MNIITKNNIATIAIFITCILFGCKKLVEVAPPKGSTTSGALFANNQSAISAINGLYGQISREGINGSSIAGVSCYAGLSADEFNSMLTSFNVDFNTFYRNELTAELSVGFWSASYGVINSATNAIEGLKAQATNDEDRSSELTPGAKKQLMGEAKFIRAMCYFYLVNLFGDVPLVLEGKIFDNAQLLRTDKTKVYEQIIKDLTEAKELLSTNFLTNTLANSTTERVRPTRWAASALLARVYLYISQYEKAEAEANVVISNSSMFSLTSLNDVFLKNSLEAIWQLQPVHAGWNSFFGRYFILPLVPTGDVFDKPVSLNEAQVYCFETGDPRRVSWINSIVNSGITYYYPYKYKKGEFRDAGITSTSAMTEYNMVLRLAEQYLIRAEARARQNKIDGANGAIADLNMIRSRARGAGVVPANYGSGLSQATVLSHIDEERRYELFTEWGDRWFNLKRTGAIDAVMSVATPLKSGQDWQPHQALYPIPNDQILLYPKLIQNPGY